MKKPKIILKIFGVQEGKIFAAPIDLDPSLANVLCASATGKTACVIGRINNAKRPVR